MPAQLSKPPRPWLLVSSSALNLSLPPDPLPPRGTQGSYTPDSRPASHVRFQRQILRLGEPDSVTQANSEGGPDLLHEDPAPPCSSFTQKTKLPAGPAHGPATLPAAHVGADLRQPGEQVQCAGHGADDKANDLLSREGLRAGEAAWCPAEAKGEGRGPQAPFWGAKPPDHMATRGPPNSTPPSHARVSPYCSVPQTRVSAPGRPPSGQPLSQRFSAAGWCTPRPG